MLYRLIILAVFMLAGSISFAQGVRNTTLDTLTAEEKIQYSKASHNTAVGYYQEAKNYSTKRDSLNAGITLMKVDPYYLMFLGQTPDSISSFLEHHLKLTITAKEEYAALFTKTYNTTRAGSYTKFKMMYDEDNAVRHLIDQCADSFTCNLGQKRLFKTDSIHSDYLRNYIKQKGWPALSDGSLYAGILAIHDHLPNKDYAPALKEAILKGNTTLDLLFSVMQWEEVYDIEYSRLMDTLRTRNYRKYDISSILSGQLPSSLTKIEKTVKEFRNVRLYVTYEFEDHKKLHATFLDKKYEWEDILSKLIIDLSGYISKSDINYLAYKYGLWAVSFQPPGTGNNKVTMYVVKGN